MKNIINCSCARYSDISTITHSAKYRLNIVIDKIPQNIEISFFFQYRTPLLVSISLHNSQYLLSHRVRNLH